MSKYRSKTGKHFTLSSGASEIKAENVQKDALVNFHGKGFVITEENGNYYLEYQLARHGGGSRKFEINKAVYDDAKTGEHTISELLKKPNLYKFDIPENDVI
ncbi:MAG: hypothetical protein MI810_01395 [Flavobacteriales bacterium]|nr:hypothetical protein [Flavobacteriales bacterium]